MRELPDDGQGLLVAQVFWGLWLLPLGTLVIRSGFIPRILGVWLLLNGLAYVALSSIGLMTPSHASRAFGLAFPILFGEFAMMMWLIIVGAKPRSARVAAQ